MEELPLPWEIICIIAKYRYEPFNRRIARMQTIYTKRKFWLTYKHENPTGYHFGFEGIPGSIQGGDGSRIANLIRFSNR